MGNTENRRREPPVHARMILGANPLALGMYVGHSDGSVLEEHYTGRSVDWLRREVAEKVEGWVRARVGQVKRAQHREEEQICSSSRDHRSGQRFLDSLPVIDHGE